MKKNRCSSGGSARCWFCLTLGRLVSVLLALEGLLFLAERWHWMAKGWPVVTAIAVVALGMSLMFVWFAAAMVFRRRFQFSIGSLLALTAVIAIALSWLVAERNEAAQQRSTLDEIGRAGGYMIYDYQLDSMRTTDSLDVPMGPPPGAAWLSRPLGYDFFAEAATVTVLADTDFDRARRNIMAAPDYHAPASCEISDESLERIGGLTHLESLFLSSSKVTDAGLVHLKTLTRLKELHLDNMQVTAEGVKRLQRALPDCKIEWNPPGPDESGRRNPAG